jgi:hypothetical protein
LSKVETATNQFLPLALAVDLFSTDAIDTQMAVFTNRIIEATKQFIPQTFIGVEIDSYELGLLNLPK